MPYVVPTVILLGLKDAVRREVPGVAKRPRPDDNDAPVEVKKRNARMFGALLGHLSKSRQGPWLAVST